MNRKRPSARGVSRVVRLPARRRNTGTVTLWRACRGTGYCGRGTAWAEERNVAEFYQGGNPGFGGPVLVRATVTPEYVLDLRSRDSSRRWSDLADALTDSSYRDPILARYGERDGDGDLTGRIDLDALRELGGGYVHGTWENSRMIHDALAEQYSWVWYEEDNPPNTWTWVLLDDTRFPVEVVAQSENPRRVRR